MLQMVEHSVLIGLRIKKTPQALREVQKVVPERVTECQGSFCNTIVINSSNLG